jgi:hypothetical protein
MQTATKGEVAQAMAGFRHQAEMIGAVQPRLYWFASGGLFGLREQDDGQVANALRR